MITSPAVPVIVNCAFKFAQIGVVTAATVADSNGGCVIEMLEPVNVQPLLSTTDNTYVPIVRPVISSVEANADPFFVHEYVNGVDPPVTVASMEPFEFP